MKYTEDTILSVQSLSKAYKTYKQDPTFMGSLKNFFFRKDILIQALHPISFEVKRGEFLGVLGPNGAGKTTTLKMLTGLIAPTQGQALAFGTYDTSKRDPNYLSRIGMVMGQRQQLLPDLPALDSFYLSKALYEIDDGVFDTRLNDFLDMLSVHDKATVPVRKLSLGERMKMELILSMLHHPEILFLDEPTIGLDFHAAKIIRDFLLRMNREFKMTILLTSHYSKDIEELCDRVILINHGHKVYDGPLSGVDERVHGQRRVELKFKDTHDFEFAKTQIFPNLQKQYSGLILEDSEDINTLRTVMETKETQKILSQIFSQIKPDSLSDLLVGEQPLDETFARIYQNTRFDL